MVESPLPDVVHDLVVLEKQSGGKKSGLIYGRSIAHNKDFLVRNGPVMLDQFVKNTCDGLNSKSPLVVCLKAKKMLNQTFLFVFEYSAHIEATCYFVRRGIN